MARDLYQKVFDLLSRPNVAAVLVPEHVALGFADELFGTPLSDPKRHYVQIVSTGGYIGRFNGTPMLVARDVIVCVLTRGELIETAARLGVDLAEIGRDLANVRYVAKTEDSHK